MDDWARVGGRDGTWTGLDETMASASTEPGPMEIEELPDRIKDPLMQARDFPEYQELRTFRFLHMFSGEVDVLGTV